MMTQEGAAAETKSPELVTTALSGYELLADPQLNKGTAFLWTPGDRFLCLDRPHGETMGIPPARLAIRGP